MGIRDLKEELRRHKSGAWGDQAYGNLLGLKSAFNTTGKAIKKGLKGAWGGTKWAGQTAVPLGLKGAGVGLGAGAVLGHKALKAAGPHLKDAIKDANLEDEEKFWSMMSRHKPQAAQARAQTLYAMAAREQARRKPRDHMAELKAQIQAQKEQQKSLGDLKEKMQAYEWDQKGIIQDKNIAQSLLDKEHTIKLKQMEIDAKIAAENQSFENKMTLTNTKSMSLTERIAKQEEHEKEILRIENEHAEAMIRLKAELEELKGKNPTKMPETERIFYNEQSKTRAGYIRDVKDEYKQYQDYNNSLIDKVNASDNPNKEDFVLFASSKEKEEFNNKGLQYKMFSSAQAYFLANMIRVAKPSGEDEITVLTSKIKEQFHTKKKDGDPEPPVFNGIKLKAAIEAYIRMTGYGKEAAKAEIEKIKANGYTKEQMDIVFKNYIEVRLPDKKRALLNTTGVTSGFMLFMKEVWGLGAALTEGEKKLLASDYLTKTGVWGNLMTKIFDYDNPSKINIAETLRSTMLSQTALTYASYNSKYKQGKDLYNKTLISRSGSIKLIKRRTRLINSLKYMAHGVEQSFPAYKNYFEGQ